MKCTRVERLLLEYLEHRLDPKRAPSVHEHLAGCPGCREKLEAFRQTLAITTLDTLPPAPDPERFLQDVRRRVRVETADTRRWTPRILVLGGSLALATIVLLGITLSVRHRPATAGSDLLEAALAPDTTSVADFLDAAPQSFEVLTDSERQALYGLESELVQNTDFDDLLDELNTDEMSQLLAGLEHVYGRPPKGG